MSNNPDNFEFRSGFPDGKRTDDTGVQVETSVRPIYSISHETLAESTAHATGSNNTQGAIASTKTAASNSPEDGFDAIKEVGGSDSFTKLSFTEFFGLGDGPDSPVGQSAVSTGEFDLSAVEKSPLGVTIPDDLSLENSGSDAAVSHTFYDDLFL